MKESIHFSSQSDEWETPQDLFDELNAIFHFQLDACASEDNFKCLPAFTKARSTLNRDWGKGPVWMNPPYGRVIGAFMRKAWESSRAGATVVCLVPARTDTQWWHKYASKGTILFLKGRLRFVGAKWNAPFPSAIVIFWGGILGEAQ